jgi:hypothetical protein
MIKPNYITLIVLVSLGLGCGQPTDNELEIVGSWVTPWGVETITEDTWEAAKIVAIDNGLNTVITKTKAETESPETFSKLVWTDLERDRFHYCTVAYGLDSQDAAHNAVDISDPNDLNETGCGGFPWTMMRLPLSITGSYGSEFGAETISETHWDNGFSSHQIKDWNEEKKWVITQVPANADHAPNSFNTIFWISYTEGESSGLYYCTHAYGLENLAAAHTASGDVPDSSNPHASGCGDFAWTKLELR